MYLISNVEVDWMMDFGNSPRILVSFTKDTNEEIVSILKGHTFRYTCKDGFYRSILGERVDYFYHPDKGITNAGGFSGRSITILLEDGSEVVLQGPWSSNSLVVNRIYADGNDAIEVSIVNEDKNKIATATAATVAGVARWIKENNPDFGLVKTNSLFCPYQVCFKDGTLKDSTHIVYERLA